LFVFWSTGAVVKFAILTTAGAVSTATTTLNTYGGGDLAKRLTCAVGTTKATVLIQTEDGTNAWKRNVDKARITSAGAVDSAVAILKQDVGLFTGMSLAASADTFYFIAGYYKDDTIFGAATNRPVVDSKLLVMDTNGYIYGSLYNGRMPSTDTYITGVIDNIYLVPLIRTSSTEFKTSIIKESNNVIGSDQNGVTYWGDLIFGKLVVNSQDSSKKLDLKGIRDINNIALIPNASTHIYDGRIIAEQHFYSIPALISIAGTGAGAAFPTGDYQFAAIYSWADNQGNFYRSAPSPIETLTLAVAQADLEVEVSTYHLASPNMTNISIELYRTEKDGSIFYQCGTEPNDTTVDLITFTVDQPDANILSNQLIYTTGGVLEANLPPAAKILYIDTEYCFLVPYEDERQLWVSKPTQPDLIPEFSDFLIWNVPNSDKGPITGIGSIQGRRIIFRENDIYVLNGSGPNNLGQGTLSFQLLTTDVGCLAEQSLVETPMGLAFFSRRGIVLLDKGFNIQPIGRPIEGYGLTTSDIYTSQLDASKKEVIWSTTSGTFYWDYEHNIWSIAPSLEIVDSTIWDNKLTIVSNEETSAKSQVATFSASDTLKVKTPWIRLGALGGFQRVRYFELVGEFRSAHTLNIKIYINYDETTVVQTVVYDSTDIQTVANDPFICRGHIQYQKCNAIMFEIYDSDQSGTNESLALTSLSLELGVKRSLGKLSNDKSQ
jgi:hypothetical protein